MNNRTKIVQALLPQDCVLCGASIQSGKLCPDCHADLPFHTTFSCPVCATPTLGGCICGNCLKHAPSYGSTLAGLSYTFPVDALIHSFKYGGNLAVLDILTEPLIHLAAIRPKPELLIPLPLHPTKLRERGFNQSVEIARLLARKLALPIAANCCVRVRDTLPQASMPLKKRHDNVKGAFACQGDLQGKHVAVVDDVMTTGATLDEIGRVLLKAGVASISNWVVARALPHP